jgi:ketosteroid isomerase-like protein
MPAHSPEETHALIAGALNSGNLDAFVDVYEQGAVLVVPPNGEHAHGREEIREAVKETFALEPTVTIEVVGKLEAEGLALTLGRWQLEGTDPDGNRVGLDGHGALVSRRGPDGSWRVLLDHPMRPS